MERDGLIIFAPREAHEKVRDLLKKLDVLTNCGTGEADEDVQIDVCRPGVNRKDACYDPAEGQSGRSRPANGINHRFRTGAGSCRGIGGGDAARQANE